MATYAQTAALRNNAGFLSRCEIAVARFANYILGEDPSVTSHRKRYNWATSAILSPSAVASQLGPAIALDPTLQSEMDTIAGQNAGSIPDYSVVGSDTQVQVAVEIQINQILVF